jgi:hypothetical protein
MPVENHSREGLHAGMAQRVVESCGRARASFRSLAVRKRYHRLETVVRSKEFSFASRGKRGRAQGLTDA